VDFDEDGVLDASFDTRLTLTGLKNDVYCVRWNGHFGRTAALTSGDKIFTSEWELQAEGKETQTVTISNSNAGKSTYKMGEYAVISTSGALSSGVSPPSTSNVYVVHSNTLDDGWRVISRSRYQEWNQYVRNQLMDDITQWQEGTLINGSDAVESKANQRARRAYEQFDGAEITSGISVEDTSWSSGTFVYDTSEVLGFSRMQIYIDAGPDGYVEVSKPVGEARIVSSSGTEVSEFDSDTVSVTFENVAGSEGSFTGQVESCSNSFTYEGVTKRATVDSGSQETFEFKVSFASDSNQEEKVNGQCELAVTNAEGSTVSTSVDVVGEQKTECTEGSENVRVLENGTEAIVKCTDGFNTEIVEECESNEEARLVSTNNGEDDYECRKGSGPGGSNGECVLWDVGDDGNPVTPYYPLKDPFCGEDLLGQVGEAFSLVFSGVAGIVGGLAAAVAVLWVDGERRIRGGFKPLKTRKQSRVKNGNLLLGVLAFLVVGVLAFTVAALLPTLIQVAVAAVAVIAMVGRLVLRSAIPGV